MEITRQGVINEARKYLGVKYSHQGRNVKNGLDCGGLLIVVTQNLGINELEILGYSSFPQDGRFDEILQTNAVDLKIESEYPHNFTGEEFQPADIISFDYQNGEGTRHIGFITKWDGNSYWILHAIPDYGVVENRLSHPFSKAKIKGWRLSVFS